MKARFALDLSESRIALLHRGASGWQPVGAVAMDDADLDLNIARMRAKAEAYSGESIRADLILPQEMVLFMELPRMPERDAEEHIEHALHGRTPYALHQLAYDYEFEDGMCLVAIVARETLREASEFAVGHGIEVASFACAPDGDRRHVPNFPVSAMIEPEVAPAPVAEPVEAAAPESEPAATETVVPEGEPVATEAAAEEAIAAERTPAEAEATQAAPAEAEVYGPVDMRAVTAAEAPADAEADIAAAADRDETEVEVAAEALEVTETEDADLEVAAEFDSSVSTAVFEHAAEAPAEEDDHVISFGPAAERAARAGRSIGAVFDDDSRMVSESTSRISFNPIGGPERNLSLGIGGMPRMGSDGSAPGSFAARRAAIASITGIEVGQGSASAIRQSSAPVTSRPFASQIELPKPETPRDESDAMTVFGARGAPEPRLVAARAMFAVAAAVVLLIGLGAFTASWLFGPDDPLSAGEPFAEALPSAIEPEPEFGPALEAPVVTADVPVEAETAPEVEPAPEIAALDALIEETDAAVEVLAAVEPEEPEAAVPAPSTEEAVNAALSEALGIEQESQEAAEAPLPSLADIAGQPAAGFVARPAGAPSPRADLPEESDIIVPSGEAPSREAMLASYAATGIWPVAPDVPRQPGSPEAEVELPQQGDAALRRAVGALGAPADIAPQPVSAIPPVGPGITFDLDPDGLVTPSAEGTLSPEGILVYAGAPVKTPPLRVVPTPEPDARVVGAKPKARPVVPEEVVQRLEEANAASSIRIQALDGAGPNGFVLGPEDVAVRALHEGRKPKARPAEERADAASAPSAEEAREALFRTADPEVEDNTVSGFAVAVSARPSARPAAIAASAATSASPEIAPQAATPAAPATPVVARSTGPQLPTTASVARAATTPDAIAMRRLSLIGVYGTQTKRRALVRMPTGRFEKVKVGDRLDGGVVQAISEDALLYVKGRKQIVIALPET